MDIFHEQNAKGCGCANAKKAQAQGSETRYLLLSCLIIESSLLLDCHVKGFELCIDEDQRGHDELLRCVTRTPLTIKFARRAIADLSNGLAFYLLLNPEKNIPGESWAIEEYQERHNHWSGTASGMSQKMDENDFTCDFTRAA